MEEYICQTHNVRVRIETDTRGREHQSIAHYLGDVTSACSLPRMATPQETKPGDLWNSSVLDRDVLTNCLITKEA